jgi:hypothetical protein
MSKKMIDKLTKEQEDQIPVYLKKWLDIGYRTASMDREKVKSGVEFLYKTFLHMDAPEIHFVDSPIAAQKLANELCAKYSGVTPDPDAKPEYHDVARSNWWMSYYAFYDFVLNVIFPEEIVNFPKFIEFLEHSKEIHLLWTFDKAAIVCDFPSEINLNEDNKLHSTQSGGLVYRDGFSVYALEGNAMTKEDWEKVTLKFKSTLANSVFKQL